MSYELSLSYRDDYIQVLLSGEDSYQVGYEVFSKVADACRKYNCYKVLGISEMDNPLEPMEAFDHRDIFRDLGFSAKHVIAWVEKNPDARYILELIVETEVNNREIIRGRVFSQTQNARDWLSSQ